MPLSVLWLFQAAGDLYVALILFTHCSTACDCRITPNNHRLHPAIANFHCLIFRYSHGLGMILWISKKLLKAIDRKDMYGHRPKAWLMMDWNNIVPFDSHPPANGEMNILGMLFVPIAPLSIRSLKLYHPWPHVNWLPGPPVFMSTTAPPHEFNPRETNSSLRSHAQHTVWVAAG